MTRFARLLAAAALAASAAAPAAAQYGQTYPQPYPQPSPQTYPQPGYGYGYNQGYGNNQGAIGAIIDSLIGNRYNVSDRQAIHQCAYAAVQRAQNRYAGGYQAYPGYNNFLRVTSITDVQRRSTGVRVRGTLGRSFDGNRPYGAPGYGNPPYGGPPYPGYGTPGYGAPGYGAQGYGRAEFSFRCDVDYRGAYVRNVRIEPLYRNY